jgi:hypothetical protein
MGRSQGKVFKEKGISLYKDKEISTIHAKVSISSCFHGFDYYSCYYYRLNCEMVKRFSLIQKVQMEVNSMGNNYTILLFSLIMFLFIINM